MAKVPLHPKHPEQVCWGCDKYCPVDSLACGNGTVRTQHPVELFGEDWLDWTMRKIGILSPKLRNHGLTSAANHSSRPLLT